MQALSGISRSLRKQLTPKRFLIVLSAFCLCQAAILHLNSRLQALTGTLILDLRSQGYTAADVQEFLDAAGTQGRKQYALIGVIDLGIYMWSYAYLLSGLLSMASVVAPTEGLKLLNLLPWTAALADAVENVLILSMLASYPNLMDRLAHIVPLFSQAKWLLLYASVCAVAGTGCYCLAVAAGMAGKRQQRGARGDGGSTSAGSSSRQRQKRQ